MSITRNFKNFSAIALLAVTVSLPGISLIAEDFPFFITDDGHVYQETTNGGRFIRPEKYREALQAKESRPANLDIEGNWGQVTFGTQVSLRFANATFSTNEPVIATLIIRNVGDQEGNYLHRADEVANSLVVIGPQGKPLERTDVSKPADARMASAIAAVTRIHPYFLSPGMQRKFEVDLQTHFDLSAPGRYTVYARPGVLNPATRKYTEIQSGNATITVK